MWKEGREKKKKGKKSVPKKTRPIFFEKRRTKKKERIKGVKKNANKKNCENKKIIFSSFSQEIF